VQGWLLDPQSTCEIASSPELLVSGSLREWQNKLRLPMNAGILLVNQKAKIPGYDCEIWFSKKGIANVLSFKHTKASGLWIEYDCGADGFTLERKWFNDHSDMLFQMHDSGLHYWEDPKAFCMLNTVEENMQLFTK
jgi:hypothetical protein